MGNSNNLLNKYLLLYKKNPRSKVFAPLAESYRKLGLFEEAYKIIQQGIKNHPTYVLGFVVLAHLYYDEKKYELAYSTLHSLATQNRDNISMQRLFGDICLMLSKFDEALETFKYVLFLNPSDQYAIKHVKELEDDLAQKAELEIESRKLNKTEFTIDDEVFIEDSWEQVDLNNINLQTSDEGAFTQEEKEHVTSQPVPVEEDEDQWELKAPLNDNIEKLKKEIQDNNIKVHPKDLEDKFFEAEEYSDPRFEEVPEIEDIQDLSDSDEDIEKEKEASDASDGKSPFINHTLVDLYLRQGHEDKAIDILRKILSLHPNDEFTRNRIIELGGTTTLSNEQDQTEEPITLYKNEDDQHTDLTNLVEENVSYQKNYKKLKELYGNFLLEIKNRRTDR